jgi:hypothetical protein
MSGMRRCFSTVDSRPDSRRCMKKRFKLWYLEARIYLMFGFATDAESFQRDFCDRSFNQCLACAVGVSCRESSSFALLTLFTTSIANWHHIHRVVGQCEDLLVSFVRDSPDVGLQVIAYTC